MIYDALKNAERYNGLSANFQRAFEFLRSADLSSMAVGRYDIDGDNVYIMIQEPTLKPWSEGRWEAHQKYADIQLVINGCECIGYCAVDGTQIETPYSPENDLLFYQEMDGNAALVHGGEMMIFFPSDAHRPCIQPSEAKSTIRKAVVKVRL